MELLTPKEVQATLKCSLAYVYKLVDRGHLPCVGFPQMGQGTEKPRSLIRFKRSDVVKFIEDHCTTT
jgi:excisionase family DNA binding protein